MRGDEHDWHTWNFSYPSLQVLITGSHNIYSVLLDPFHNAVIRIGAFMIAF